MEYVSDQRARLNDLSTRPDALSGEEVRWLLTQLTTADWQLEELRDRIDRAGSLMVTAYVAEAIDYDRWSRATPRGPVTANG